MNDRSCPRCKEDVTLVDPTEDVWDLNPEDFDDDAEVWLCTSCGWHEEATIVEAMEEHIANLEWVMERLGHIND